MLAMPLVFPIPYGTILLVAAVSLVCAFLSSWGPVQQMLSQPIVRTLSSRPRTLSISPAGKCDEEHLREYSYIATRYSDCAQDNRAHLNKEERASE